MTGVKLTTFDPARPSGPLAYLRLHTPDSGLLALPNFAAFLNAVHTIYVAACEESFEVLADQISRTMVYSEFLANSIGIPEPTEDIVDQFARLYASATVYVDTFVSTEWEYSAWERQRLSHQVTQHLVRSDATPYGRLDRLPRSYLAEFFVSTAEAPPGVLQNARSGSAILEILASTTLAGTGGGILWLLGRALKHGPDTLHDWLTLRSKVRAQRAQNDAEEAEADLREVEARAALARIRATQPRLEVTAHSRDGSEVNLPAGER